MSEPDDDFSSLHGLGPQELPALHMKHALLNQRVTRLQKDVEEHEECRRDDMKDLREWIDKNVALKTDVKLSIKLVYSTAATVLVAFLAALVSLVMKGHPG